MRLELPLKIFDFLSPMRPFFPHVVVFRQLGKYLKTGSRRPTTLFTIPYVVDHILQLSNAFDRQLRHHSAVESERLPKGLTLF